MPKEIISINPATGEILGQASVTPRTEITEKVAQARQAQKTWQELGLTKRVDILRGLVTLLDQEKDGLSQITTTEMGRLLSSTRNLNDYAVQQFSWNLDHAQEILKSEITFEDDKTINEVVYEPYGVMACILAWNFPILNFVFSAVQALIAGNAVVLKYSEEIPLFTQKLEAICAKSALPPHVLSFVYGNGTVGEALLSENIDIVSFTGSSATGRKVHQKAAEKGIPAVLEMGGSSPCLVFPDVNLPSILKTIFAARFNLCGQSCDSLKRLIVHKTLFDPCVKGLAELAGQLHLGSPMDLSTELGPLVAERQVVRLEEQVQDALNKGATLICGGHRPKDRQGAWYTPTILTNIAKDMRVWTEEVFGPVLPIVSFETYEEAITLANDTHYGLTASVFTNDKTIGSRASCDLKAGCIGLNGQNFFKPQNPFGGFKQSGLGRENGKWGFHDVCRPKVIAREK